MSRPSRSPHPLRHQTSHLNSICQSSASLLAIGSGAWRKSNWSLALTHDIDRRVWQLRPFLRLAPDLKSAKVGLDFITSLALCPCVGFLLLASKYEDPNLLRLNATLHRMERDRCLVLARRSQKFIWLCGRRRYRKYITLVREHQFLAKWFQHMAERFDVISK